MAMTKKEIKDAKKIIHSFDSDLKKEMKNEEFRKGFNRELLKLRIADEIIKLRKKKRISQKELAKTINTTQAVISRIENRQVFPSTNLIQRICNAYNVKAEFRFC